MELALNERKIISLYLSMDMVKNHIEESERRLNILKKDYVSLEQYTKKNIDLKKELDSLNAYTPKSMADSMKNKMDKAHMESMIQYGSIKNIENELLKELKSVTEKSKELNTIQNTIKIFFANSEK